MQVPPFQNGQQRRAAKELEETQPNGVGVPKSLGRDLPKLISG